MTSSTTELEAEEVEVASQCKLGSIFTRGVVRNPNGPLAALMRPSSAANWMGGGMDPETNIVYVYSSSEVKMLGLLNDPKRSDMNYIQGIAGAAPSAGGGEGGGGVTVQGLPLTRPPWGRISAIDLNQGESVWQVAHGATPDNVRNHPALKGVTIPRTGRPGRIGLMVTKTLVVSGGRVLHRHLANEARCFEHATRPAGRNGEVTMPAPQTGSPMTYMFSGRQYHRRFARRRRAARQRAHRVQAAFVKGSGAFFMELSAKRHPTAWRARDAVGAPAVAGHDVVGPLDAHTLPQQPPKQIELCRAEALAGGGGGADRAMVFDEEKRAAAIRLHLRHVAFLRPHARQLLKRSPQRRRRSDSRPVIRLLSSQPGFEQTRHSPGAKGRSHRVDERDAYLRVGVRKQPIGLLCQPPVLGWAADWDRAFSALTSRLPGGQAAARPSG